MISDNQKKKLLSQETGLDESEINLEDWLFMTDQEAEAACKEYIEESIEHFCPEFLSNETGIKEHVFIALFKSEDWDKHHEAVLSLVNETVGIDNIASSAMSMDGRGHFLSSYDGEEIELNSNLFAYRIN